MFKRFDVFIKNKIIKGIMIRDYQKFNRLANIANSTFGSTGTGPMERPRTSKVTVEIINEKTMKILYTAILNFPSKSLLNNAMPKHKADAMSVIASALRSFAKQYEEQYGEKIQLEVVDESYQPNVEFISSSMYAPVQRGFYRSHCLVKVK